MLETCRSRAFNAASFTIQCAWRRYRIRVKTKCVEMVQRGNNSIHMVLPKKSSCNYCLWTRNCFFFVFSCKEMDSTEAFVSPARARSRHPACIPSSSLPEAVAQAPVAFPRRRQTRTRNHGMQQRHFRWFDVVILHNFLANRSLSGSGSADPDCHEQWCYSLLVKAPWRSQVPWVSAENTFKATFT